MGYVKKLSNEKTVILLGITVQDKFSFKPHLNDVCEKVSHENRAPTIVSKFIPQKRTQSHYDSIYNISVFLLPLGLDVPQQSKINTLHERVLTPFHDDRQSTFEELHNKNKSVTVFHRKSQVLATELYKKHHKLIPDIMNGNFKIT